MDSKNSLFMTSKLKWRAKIPKKEKCLWVGDDSYDNVQLGKLYGDKDIVIRIRT